MIKRFQKTLTVTQMNEKRGFFSTDYDRRANLDLTANVITVDGSTREEL